MKRERDEGEGKSQDKKVEKEEKLLGETLLRASLRIRDILCGALSFFFSRERGWQGILTVMQEHGAFKRNTAFASCQRENTMCFGFHSLAKSLLLVASLQRLKSKRSE